MNRPLQINYPGAVASRPKAQFSFVPDGTSKGNKKGKRSKDSKGSGGNSSSGASTDKEGDEEEDDSSDSGSFRSAKSSAGSVGSNSRSRSRDGGSGMVEAVGNTVGSGERTVKVEKKMEMEKTKRGKMRTRVRMVSIQATKGTKSLMICW